MTIEPTRTTFRCSGQKRVAERLVATLRPELLDVIVLNEGSLHSLLSEFLAYDQVDRIHVALAKDAP